MTLQDVLKGGLDVCLAVAVIALWTRLNVITDRFIERFDKGDAERKAIAEQLGLTTQDLRTAIESAKKHKDL